jgi:hypothetical protein
MLPVLFAIVFILLAVFAAVCLLRNRRKDANEQVKNQETDYELPSN